MIIEEILTVLDGICIEVLTINISTLESLEERCESISNLFKNNDTFIPIECDYLLSKVKSEIRRLHTSSSGSIDAKYDGKPLVHVPYTAGNLTESSRNTVINESKGAIISTGASSVNSRANESLVSTYYIDILKSLDQSVDSKSMLNMRNNETQQGSGEEFKEDLLINAFDVLEQQPQPSISSSVYSTTRLIQSSQSHPLFGGLHQGLSKSM